MAHSGTQISKVASELASTPAAPEAMPSLEALNNHPSVLAARELIQEAREHVARSRHLIERGRNLRQQAEATMQAFRKRQRDL